MSDYTFSTDDVRETFYDAPGMQSPRYDGTEFDRWLAAHDAEVRQDFAKHREVDADNSCSDPDCCGGPYPYMVCELCLTEWPCPTVATARGEGEQA